MEIPQGNTIENSGKQNPEIGFKSPPSRGEKSPRLATSTTSSWRESLGGTKFVLCRVQVEAGNADSGFPTDPNASTINYSEGLFVGYRGYEKNHIQPSATNGLPAHISIRSMTKVPLVSITLRIAH